METKKKWGRQICNVCFHQDDVNAARVALAAEVCVRNQFHIAPTSLSSK